MVKMKISQLELRIIKLGRFIKDGKLEMLIIDGKPIPAVDVFLTEEEFIKNANADFEDFDYMITKEFCQNLYSFDFLPKAGFLSNKVKLTPFTRTIKESIQENDSSMLKRILTRKRAIYSAQSKEFLSCKDDLEYVGVKGRSIRSSYDLKYYQSWEPIYLLSQIYDLKKLYFQLADRAIKGILYYRNKLNEFEKLIDLEGIKEERIQEYLEENPWIFGTEYTKAIPKMKLSHNIVADFILNRFDDSWEVVELELPNDNLFTNKMNIRSKVTHAVGQVQNAQEFMLKHYDFLKTAEEISAYKPKGLVVIGRDLVAEEREKIDVVNKSYADIRIITYGDLLQKAQREIDMFSRLFKVEE